ncbi:TlpA family protein disulfide reductase [uncultured Amnibacterium sp.]|uniref:TlpA family protein disulfide reductase n=1 Tax=uncultured Amnibacterium sp. TaxID=1631851 RepID=UPI0035CB9176
MSPQVALAALAALVFVAAALGVLQRVLAGRARRGSGETIGQSDLGAATTFGDRATLVQLSSPTCSSCPGTARLLREVAAQAPGVVHVEIDLARRPDLADRFHVLQTPTTLVVDADRRIRARFGGPPRRDVVDRELESVLGGPHAR